MYVLLNWIIDLCLLCKYNLLEEKKSSCLLHNLLYMDVIFIFLFIYCHSIFYANYTIYRIFVIV
jgi:hypothetical protein